MVILVVGGLPPEAEHPASARVHTADVLWSAEGGTFESQAIDRDLTMIGLVWDQAAPLTAWYRTKVDGRWGAWSALSVEEDHGPDPGTEEAERSLAGSDPVWVGESEGVQFRMAGATARDARAILIDTSDEDDPVFEELADFLTPRIAPASGAPAQPVIRPRSQWDPNSECPPRDEPDDGQITHFFVHHTVASNTYTLADLPGYILGVCKFHRNSRGWDDIGYNFLIDRFGNIWEGRAGGITRGIQGGHTAGFNTYSVGVAFIGNHATSGPTPAAEAALQSLIAWKANIHNVNTNVRTVVVSKGSEKYDVGVPVSLWAISGHRDGQATSCPGEACYNRLPVYRSRVAQQWTQVPLSTYRTPLVGDFDGDGTDEGAVFRTTDGRWLLTQPSGATSTWADYATSKGWTSQLAGDFDGDGRDDIANFHPANGTWWVSRSTGSGSSLRLWADFSTASGWGRQLVGDFNGDGRDDIANYHPANGTWWVSRSTGSGFTTTLWADFSTASGWSSQIVGDFNGDGRDDIANFHPANGTWWVSRSTGSGFATSLWADFSTASGWTIQLAGDFDGNGRDDIANRHVGNGTWWVARSSGSSFAPATLWGTNASLDHISHAWIQDYNEDGREDIFTVDAYNGYLDRHRANGASFTIEAIVDTPWRTTVGGAARERQGGTNGLLFFGQEFQWVRVSNLGTSGGGSASATVIATHPRP